LLVRALALEVVVEAVVALEDEAVGVQQTAISVNSEVVVEAADSAAVLVARHLNPTEEVEVEVDSEVLLPQLLMAVLLHTAVVATLVVVEATVRSSSCLALNSSCFNTDISQQATHPEVAANLGGRCST
jgi:hypothetical protein